MIDKQEKSHLDKIIEMYLKVEVSIVIPQGGVVSWQNFAIKYGIVGGSFYFGNCSSNL